MTRPRRACADTIQTCRSQDASSSVVAVIGRQSAFVPDHAVDDVRRPATSGKNLSDASVTADGHPSTRSPRRFGQLPSLGVPDNFDDPLPDAEIAAWEGDSPP